MQTSRVARVAFGVLAWQVAACCPQMTAPTAPASPTPTTTTPSAAPPIGEPPSSPPPLTAPTLRLPSGVRPTRYAIELTLDPRSENFSGTATIALRIDQPTRVIWLHAAALTIDSARIKLGAIETPVRVARGEPATKDNQEFVAFVADRPIAAGTGELAISYRGGLSAVDSDGAYRVEERGEWYIYTQFESTSARRAFPCFDEPAYKVPFGLALRVRRDHEAVANTPAISTTEEPNGMKLVRFADTKPLPSYLVAFAVGPFDIVDAGKGGRAGVPLRIIATKGRGAEAGYAAKATQELVGALEDYFGVPYPYEKLDQIAVPRKGGAMENAGLITYGLPLILIARDEETIARKRRFLSIAAHEIGHHWFGDLVTMAWWDDTWLNEAFATWIENKIVERLQPTWGMDVAAVERRSGAMYADSLATARRIREPIASRHDIPAAFDGITYGKGASIIAMFERWVGPDKFQRGLKSYFEQHAHGNATTSEFLAAISAQAGSDVAPVISTFLDQVGAPLVTAELVCAAGSAKLVLAQQRMLPIGSTAVADQTWRIPMSITYGDGDKPSATIATTLEQRTGEVQLPGKCPRWVHANSGQLGYYRVLYKGDLLERLLAGLKLTIPERVGIYGDIGAMVDAGQLPLAKALALIAPLAKETNRHLAAIAANYASWLSTEYTPPALRPNRARFIRGIFGARARALGFALRPTEDDDARLQRPGWVSRVANIGEDPTLIAEAKRLADGWLKDRKTIAPELVGLVLGIAVRFGDRALFDRLRTAARGERERRDRTAMIEAMGGFRDPAIAKDAMAIALTDELPVTESQSLVWGALGNEETRELAYQFIKTNLDALIARGPHDAEARFISIGSAFCDEAHRDDAAAFFKDKAVNWLNGPRTIARMIESANLCVARKRAFEPAVSEFLKKW